MDSSDSVNPSPKLVQRALRYLEIQTKANKAYYLRNRDRIRERSLAYWQAHKEDLNQKRRARTEARRAVTNQETEKLVTE